jgi:large subunit ribosomal protein L9
MKVILRENIENLGRMGDIVNVAPGYARNFLLPKSFAVEANTKNVKAMEHEKRIIQERSKKLLADAQAFAERVSSMALTIRAKAGEEEKLFGSVTTMDIAEAMKAEGVEVDKKKIGRGHPQGAGSA